MTQPLEERCTRLESTYKTIANGFDNKADTGFRAYFEALEMITECPRYWASDGWYYGPQTKRQMITMIRRLKQDALKGLDLFAETYGYKKRTGGLFTLMKGLKRLTDYAIETIEIAEQAKEQTAE